MNTKNWRPALAVFILGALLTAGCESNGARRGGTGRNRHPAASTGRVSLHAHGLHGADQAAEDAVRRVLEGQRGVSDIAVDRAWGQITFTLTDPATVEQVLGALEAAGYSASEGKESDSEHPKKSEHPDHPRTSEHPDHPKSSEHPEHPK